MSDEINRLVEEAKRLREEGLTPTEIAREMNISAATVQWLLSKSSESEMPPSDVMIGWRSIGIYPERIASLASVYASIIEEEQMKLDFDTETIAAIAINGIPFATVTAMQLGTELAVIRVSEEYHTSFGTNYAGLKGKNTVIIDDVISSGKTVTATINAINNAGGNVKLVVVLVNKTSKNDVAGVPLRSVIRAITIS